MSQLSQLHFILATQAATAVLFKRGPGNSMCLVGWDRGDDTFERGQCLRQLIQPDVPDLSPDGQWLTYWVETHKQHRDFPSYLAGPDAVPQTMS